MEVITELQAFLQNLLIYGTQMSDALNSTLVSSPLIATVTNIVYATVIDSDPTWMQFTQSVVTLDMFGLPAATCPYCGMKAGVMQRSAKRRFLCGRCGGRTEFFMPSKDNEVAKFKNHYVWKFPDTNRSWLWTPKPTGEVTEQPILILEP
jgi:ribosomal protein S27AE